MRCSAQQGHCDVWAARPSTPQLCCPGRHPCCLRHRWRILHVLHWVQCRVPAWLCAEEKGLLLVWNTSLIITSVVFCSGHKAWAPISQQVFSPGPLGIIPEKAALGLGTLDALGELCGTAEEQQFLEDGRSPSWVSPSLCVFLCSIPAVWWAAPARMCLQTVGMTQF